jgi:hypothetical protein
VLALVDGLSGEMWRADKEGARALRCYAVWLCALVPGRGQKQLSGGQGPRPEEQFEWIRTAPVAPKDQVHY